MNDLSLALPPLYRAWIDKVLGMPIVSEPRATCEHCAMCAYHERPAKADTYFNPNTKCCSYYPTLPNFLVGAVICDNDPNYAEAKEHFIRGAFTTEITPYGIEPPYWIRFFYKLKAFGKFEQVLCPFYMQNRVHACSIYKYRNARCSTWFCKHERGSPGWKFWKKLDQLLTHAETELAKKCIAKLEVIIPAEPGDVREKFWGNWMFREPEFFQECWKIVRPLTWEEVLQIVGDELKRVATELQESFTQLNSPSFPKSLRAGEYSEEDVGEGFVRLWGYSKYNPIDVRKEVADSLFYFDGRPVDEVLNEIQKENSIHIDDELLLQLTDYEILVPG
jgi:hypothetical protein